MRMLMSIPDGTSKWGLRESGWIGLQPGGLCVHDEPQSKHVPNWDGNGYAVSACLFCLSFVPRFGTDLAGRSTYAYMWNQYEVFLFDWEYAPHNISHTHAEIDIGHFPDLIFLPRRGKRRRLKVTEGYRRYNSQVRALMTNRWIRRAHFALSLIGDAMQCYCQTTGLKYRWTRAEED